MCGSRDRKGFVLGRRLGDLFDAKGRIYVSDISKQTTKAPHVEITCSTQ